MRLCWGFDMKLLSKLIEFCVCMSVYGRMGVVCVGVCVFTY